MVKPNDATAFWAHVRKESDDACWPWTASRGRRGYGQISMAGRQWQAHRLAYTLARGPIPHGIQVCHTCDNPPCCNPTHLFLGTCADNLADMWAKGRGPSGDRNGARTHPERLARGDRSGSHLHEGCKGEKNGRARLTETQVATMRTRYAAGGITQPQLAQEFGVAPHTIWLLLHHKTWIGKDPPSWAIAYAHDYERAALAEDPAGWWERLAIAAAAVRPGRTTL